MHQITWWKEHPVSFRKFHISVVFIERYLCFFLVRKKNTTCPPCSQTGSTTRSKNMSQIGSFPQVGLKLKHLWNQHLVMLIENLSSGFLTSVSFTKTNSQEPKNNSPRLPPIGSICHLARHPLQYGNGIGSFLGSGSHFFRAPAETP